MVWAFIIVVTLLQLAMLVERRHCFISIPRIVSVSEYGSRTSSMESPLSHDLRTITLDLVRLVLAPTAGS
jgi:hypothetical protein